MTSTVYELTRIARNMGDFNPVEYARTSTSSSEPPVVKTLEERRAEEAERRDAQPQTVRCGIVGCDWPGITGTVAECREASRAHRELTHPDLIAKPARRRDRTIAEKLRAGRERRSEDRPAAGDIIDTPTTGADENFVPEHGGGTTQPLEEEKMQNPHGLQRAGRGYEWTREAAIRAIDDFVQTNSRTPRLADVIDAEIGTMPSPNAVKKLFGSWDGLVRAAGYEPVATRTPRERASASSAPTPVQPEPESTNVPTSRTDRALKLVDAARAVDDAEAALTDARAEYDRLIKELAA